MVYEYYPEPYMTQNRASRPLNGSGQNFRAKDSIIIGSMAMSTTAESGQLFSNVENTQVSFAPGRAVLEPVEGEWTVNSNLSSSTIEGYPVYPTDTYLLAIWDKDRVILAEPDDESPSIPQNLQGSVLSSTSVELSWTASNDNDVVLGYLVTIDGNNFQPVEGTSLIVEDLNPLTTYEFAVYAYDRSGNQSTLSSPLSLTTLEPESRPDPNTLLSYHWPFDNDQGTSVIDVIAGIEGEIKGSSVLQNGQMKFSSDADRVDLPAIDVVGDQITLSCKIQLDTFENANESRFISKATSTNGNDHYWMLGNFEDGSAIRFRLKVNGTTHTLITAESVITLSQTHHIAATYDGDNMRIFVDGELEASLTIANGGDISTSTATVGMGNQPTGAGDRGMRGCLDDVRIYSYAVPQEDIHLIINEISQLNYSEWLTENDFTESTTVDDDLDKDGMGLLLEYAFGTDPRVWTANPVILIEEDNEIKVTFPEIRNDLNYLIETSTDMHAWGTAGIDQTSGVVNSSEDMFLRVNVSLLTNE